RGNFRIRSLRRALFLHDLPNSLKQRLQSLMTRTRDRKDFLPWKLTSQMLHRLIIDGQVQFIGGNDLPLVCQDRAESLELFSDDAIVIRRIGAIDRIQIEQMHDDLRALDVLEEMMAQPRAILR